MSPLLQVGIPERQTLCGGLLASEVPWDGRLDKGEGSRTGPRRQWNCEDTGPRAATVGPTGSPELQPLFRVAQAGTRGSLLAGELPQAAWGGTTTLRPC